MSKIDIGIKQADRETIASELKHLLIPTHCIYRPTTSTGTLKARCSVICT